MECMIEPNKTWFWVVLLAKSIINVSNFVAGNVSPCNDADFQCLNNKIKFVFL